MKKKQFVSILNDTTFKYLLKKEESRKWFEIIIKEKINVDIRGYELYDNEINSGNKKKDYRMDIVLRKDTNNRDE